jgi:hypothetical protein
LFNIAFTAGTTHLLSAVRHHGLKVRDGAVSSARECVDFLHSVAESWPAAGQKADILDTLVKEYHPQNQSAVFEQAITLGSGSTQATRTERSGSIKQAYTQTPQATQPIAMQQQQPAAYPNQDSAFSGSFSSSYSDVPWQTPSSHAPVHIFNPQSFSEETPM